MNVILARIDNIADNRDVLNHKEDKYIVLQYRYGEVQNLFMNTEEDLKYNYYNYHNLLREQIIESNNRIDINPDVVPIIKVETKKDFKFINIRTTEEIKYYDKLYDLKYLSCDYVGIMSNRLSYGETFWMSERYTPEDLKSIIEKITRYLKTNIEEDLRSSYILNDMIAFNIMTNKENIITDKNILCINHLLDSLDGKCIFNRYYGDIEIEHGVCILAICRIQLKGISKTLNVKDQYDILKDRINRNIRE